MEYQENITALADAVGLTPKTLVHLLMAYPFADRNATSYSADPTREQFEKVEQMTSEASPIQSQKARDALAAALMIATDAYLDSIAADPEKYVPIIENLLDEITPELQQGESIDDFIHRDAGEYYVQFNPEPEKNSVGGRRAKKVTFPVDKPNAEIWSILEENTHGQLELPIGVEQQGAKDPIDIMYSINFDEIESNVPIVKRLTRYDKRVYIAANALYEAGNPIVSVTQIYHAMGRVGKPGKTDREKIYNSFLKFQARITLNNTQEIKAGYKYPKYRYEGDLYPHELRVEQDQINGQLVDITIHLFRDAPLINFAKGRKQVTEIPLKALQSPLNQTDENIAIEDYLIERIAHARTGYQPKKILLSKLYEQTGITSVKQRQRAPAKISKLLTYYKEIGEIKGFRWGKDCITLQFEKEKPLEPLVSKDEKSASRG